MIAGSTVAGPLTLHARVAIIGSGAGGALVAERLARAGHDVVILEAGPYVPASAMTQREREMTRLLYYEAGLRATEDGGVALLHGRAVGGSTVVNYLDCFRTPDRLLDEWVTSRGLRELTPTKMSPRFDRIFDLLHVHQLAPAQLNANNRKLMIGAEALGWRGDTFHRNAWNCLGSGFCDLGCAYNAKQSAALTFVPLATRQGARLYTECRAERVIFEGGRAVGVEGSVLGTDRAPRYPFRVTADLIIVSGGAIETPFLLLRSGAPDPSSQLGRNLHLHPGAPVVGWFPGERIAAYEGIKQGYFISEFSWPINGHETDALIEGIAGPPGLASTVFWGHGEERQAQFVHLNEYAIAGVLLRDHQTGVVTAGRTRPEVRYQLGASDGQRMQRAIAATAEAFLAAGATLTTTGHQPAVTLRTAADFAALWSAPTGPGRLSNFSFHQMGTARMGASRAHDVVDPTGRLWAVDNLYVADASLFPSASGVNPQITVYGLADVVADAVHARL